MLDGSISRIGLDQLPSFRHRWRHVGSKHRYIRFNPMASTIGSSRGHGRGRSRGGLGKYLRARGRRGYGRPAEFKERLVLEDEQDVELDPEEEKEFRAKYGKRQLGSNADRYSEKKDKEDEDRGQEDGNPKSSLPEGEQEQEEEEDPEVDISALLERQRLQPDTHPSSIYGNQDHPDDDSDVDQSIAFGVGNHAPSVVGKRPNRKGKVQQVVWDQSLEELAKEKNSAEAVRDLKARFRGPTPGSTTGNTSRYAKGVHLFDPKLQSSRPESGSKEEMEEFLDGLLE